jgi:sugar lactone lactonase YvrE
VSGFDLLEYNEAVAVDSAGNIYTTYGCAIRKIAPDGVMTILAGERASCYTLDGTGSDARFDFPAYVAVDNIGNLYVTETDGCTLRKVTPAGVVTTLAGLSEVPGSADGTGSAARFQYPAGVVVDSAGYIYVADWGNNTIRKVTPTGDVSTLAGSAHQFGSSDGIGRSARFYGPNGVAVDTVGNVYVTDGSNGTIRKITPAGVVTTLAGLARNFGSVDATGSVARFQPPIGIAVDSAGKLYVTDNQTVRTGGIPVTLTDAKSLKDHHLLVSLPIHFALAGEPTVECRGGAATGEHTIVFTFIRDIMKADASVTGGVGRLAGNPAISANLMSVNLTHVANAQMLTIALSRIVDIQGQSLPDTNVTMGFLLGDTTGDTVVNLSDVSQTNGRVGQMVTDSNFPSDVNADGSLTASDVWIVKGQVGNGIFVPASPTRQAASEPDRGSR